MFEKAIPLAPMQTARFGGGEGESALRAVEWRELTARLNAARELRHFLRREADLLSSTDTDAFADAAARYFRTREEGEPDVNPVALEHCKGSTGIIPEVNAGHENETNDPGYAATGDARED